MSGLIKNKSSDIRFYPSQTGQKGVIDGVQYDYGGFENKKKKEDQISHVVCP